MRLKKEKNIKTLKTVLSNYDFCLVVLIMTLCGFGLIMIHSASSFRAAYYYNDSTLYFRRQGMFIIGGMLLMIIISFLDYKKYCKKTRFLHIRPIVILYLLCVVLHWYVMFAGHSVGGSSRWIQLGGGLNLQPSEVSKLCFVLGGAFVAERKRKMINTGSTLKNIMGVVFLYLLFMPILLPVAFQNLSSAVILAGILTCVFFCVSMDKKYFIFVLAVLVIGVVIMVFTKGYRSERLMHFWYPETMESSDQIMQGLYAIAFGGLHGRGLGNSVQKLGNMPEVHTDMIFTIICEELGIVGGIMVIGLFLLLLWRIFVIALNAPDLCGALIATGVFAQVAVQVVMNIAVVTNSMPATGVPLPFVSYGGSNLIILMAEMGIVLSISRMTYKPISEIENDESELSKK